MLAADKLQLQSSLKQKATALKEKEFNLHHSNLMTVGTQAAVLAGLDVTMFIEFNPPSDSEWETSHLVPRALKFVYYITITIAFCANIIVVSHTTMLSLLGSSMALRGPDGSMITATDGLYQERKDVFFTFGVGLASTVGSVVICVWLILSPEAALVCMSLTIYTGVRLYKAYLRIHRRFLFDEDETVDFNDMIDSCNMPMVNRRGKKNRSSSNEDRSRHDYNGNGYRDEENASYFSSSSSRVEEQANNRRRPMLPKPSEPRIEFTSTNNNTGRTKETGSLIQTV